MVLISGRPNSLPLLQIKIGQRYEALLADWDIPSFVDTLYGLALLISARNQQGASFLNAALSLSCHRH